MPFRRLHGLIAATLFCGLLLPYLSSSAPLADPTTAETGESPKPSGGEGQPEGDAEALPRPTADAIAAVFDLDSRAHFHPHGEQVCASGCAASNHPTPALSSSHFQDLLRSYREEEFAAGFESGTTPALDELLYYGRQSSEWWRRATEPGVDQPVSLDERRREILQSELARSHVRLAIRVVDAEGKRRAFLPPTLVPLDRRHEFFPDTYDLQPLKASGTVKRVGRNYAWVRL